MKNTLSKIQKRCDRKLQELNHKLHSKCEACGGQNQVGHHWIEKSRSSYLRYDLGNIVPLCNSCHSKIHNVFGNNVVGGLDVAGIIIKKRGLEWKLNLDKLQPEYIKVDKAYYVDIERWLDEELEMFDLNIKTNGYPV